MSAFAAVLALGMLVTGSINTISTKLADMQCVPDFRNAAPVSECSQLASGMCSAGCRTFNHPYVQSVAMFLGELLCMFAFYASLLCKGSRSSGGLEDQQHAQKDTRKINPVVFALPAMCDMLASSIMNVGLTMTHASVYQMLRGSVVVFTGVFSVLFLGRKLQAFHWIGMALVLIGAFIVGLSSVIGHPESSAIQPSNPALGNALIVGAQLLVATQMVVEEKFLSSYKLHALQVVGWEGLWGLLLTLLSLLAMYHLPFGDDVCAGRPCVENSASAALEMGASPTLLAATLGGVASIAVFNFCGVSVTQSLSATHRMVLDSLRTMAIWAVSLALGWQAFAPLQVAGFAVLLTGTLVYNQVLSLPCLPAAAADPAEADADADGWPAAAPAAHAPAAAGKGKLAFNGDSLRRPFLDGESG